MVKTNKKIVLLFLLLSHASSYCEEKIAVFIIGMGRSGTSCTAGVLNTLGMEMGGPLAPPCSNNNKGKFEHIPTIELDQPILKELGAIWYDPRMIEWNHLPTKQAPRHLPQAPLLEQRKQELKNQVKNHLAKHFGTSNFFGIKNPELTTLLPLYTQAARELGYTPKVIIVLRHPDETNESLKKDLRTPNKNYYKNICVAYICALRNSQDCDRHVVYFQDLVNKPEKTIQALRKFLPQLKPFEGATRKEVLDFIDSGLKHHNAKGK